MVHRSLARGLAVLMACTSAGCTLHRSLSTFADGPDARSQVTVRLDDGRHLDGWLMRVGADRAMVVGPRLDGGAPTREVFDVEQIVAVDRVRPDGLGAAGGVFGALGGGLAGGIIAYARYAPECTDDGVALKGWFEWPVEEPPPPPPCRDDGAAQAAVAGAALGMLGGVLVGWIVGSTLDMRVVYTPDGRPPPPDGPTVALVPSAEGARLGLTWRW